MRDLLIMSSNSSISLPAPHASAPAPSLGWWQTLRLARRWPHDRITPVEEIYRDHGNVVLAPLWPFVNLWFINEPELIQECLVSKHKDFKKDPYYFFLKMILGHGLLTSEGQEHFRQRRMIQPAFHKQRIHQYGEAMVHYSAKMRDLWTDGQQLDAHGAMNKLALDIVGKTLFNTDVTDVAERVAHILDTLLSMESRYTNLLGHVIAKLPLPGNKVFFDTIADLDEILYGMIREHRESGDQGDLMSMLLMAQDEDDGTGMTDRQVRDEVSTLFLAGHETTAIALTWTWYLLSQNPDVEARLHEELDRVLDGRAPSASDYPQLDYTYRVFKEAMRLYPPAYIIGREAVRDTHLGPHPVRKGDMVIMAQYTMQRDPRFYPEPERFDPDRWLPERGAGIPKFAYFPFGGGNRLCVGEPFAWMEGVLVIATLAQRWKLRPEPGFAPRLHPNVTLRPDRMPMTVHAR